jgi:hypothetical protein
MPLRELEFDTPCFMPSHVLDDVLLVELREDGMHADLHPPRCGTGSTAPSSIGCSDTQPMRIVPGQNLTNQGLAIQKQAISAYRPDARVGT